MKQKLNEKSEISMDNEFNF